MNVLVLAPHPDDEAIGCGGTVAGHIASGDRVEVIFLTSGERGIKPFDAAANVRQREEEASKAAAILGIHAIDFWRLPDGRLRASSTVVERLGQELARRNAALVYTTHQDEDHVDHRAAARLLHAALDERGDGRTRALYFEVWTPLQQLDMVVDITDQLHTKIRAIRAHRSQCQIVGFDQAARGLARYRGELHSWPGGPYAEAFRQWR